MVFYWIDGSVTMSLSVSVVGFPICMVDGPKRKEHHTGSGVAVNNTYYAN